MAVRTRANKAATVAPPREVQDPSCEAKLSDRVTYLLHRVVASTVSAGTDEFRSMDINVQGARVLVALLEFGDVRAGELAGITSIDTSTLSHLLKRLERSGLLERLRSQADNRSVSVRLTDQGYGVAQACERASLAHESVLLTGFSDEETLLLRRFLKRLFENAQDGFASRPRDR